MDQSAKRPPSLVVDLTFLDGDNNIANINDNAEECVAGSGLVARGPIANGTMNDVAQSRLADPRSCCVLFENISGHVEFVGRNQGLSTEQLV